MGAAQDVLDAALNETINVLMDGGLGNDGVVLADPGVISGGVMSSDVTGDVAIELPTPYIEPPEQDDAAGGSGGGGATDAGSDTTAGGEQEEGQYEHIGNGVFRDVIDGDIWIIEGSDVAVGGRVNDDYMVNNGAQRGENPTDETGTNTGGDSVLIPDVITGGSVNVGDIATTNPVTNPVTDPVTDPNTDVTGTSTNTGDVTTTQPGTGSGGGTGGGNGTGTDVGTGGGIGGGIGNGIGTGSGDGTGDGDGDGDSTGSGTGMLSSSPENDSPVWTELFPYTTLTTPQKSVLAPMLGQIRTARGMLS
jgi:hypothetical protein